MAHLDWRISSILIAVLVSIVLTVGVYASSYGRDPSTHFGAIFASWVGGLGLFVIAGAIVAVVSLVKPENEFFDSRARILFRRQTGKHIDYIVERLRSDFEHYSEQASTVLVVKEYDALEKKFRIEQYTIVRVRSYIDDIVTTYESSVHLQDMCVSPAGRAHNRLTFVRVNDTPIGEPEEFHTSITRRFSTTVEADRICEVSYGLEFWCEAVTEANTYSPKRYTQSLKLVVENVVHPPMLVNVDLMDPAGNCLSSTPLTPGVKMVVTEVKDIPPGALAYDARVKAG